MPNIGRPSSFLDPSETLEQLLDAARYEIPGDQRAVCGLSAISADKHSAFDLCPAICWAAAATDAV